MTVPILDCPYLHLRLMMNINNRFSILLVLFLLLCQNALAQEHRHHEQLMFWNVENAFWPEDDPAVDDDEFTPEGMRHWTHGRLRHKLLQLTRVLLAAGDGRAPMVVGLAEVEGDSVMHYWTHHTPLYDQHYQYICTHGPDQRGIQTALLYQPADFHLIQADEYEVPMPAGLRPTRHLLHALGRLVSGDSLDVIVCHLPSRLGGARQSQPARDAAHQVVASLADSLLKCRLHPAVIIMGDMNDTPSSKSKGAWWGSQFVNLMLPLQRDLRTHPSAFGSHKYHGQWGYLDQFIINREHASSGVIESTNTNKSEEAATAKGDTLRSLVFSAPRSFHLPFMLTDDVTHLGHRPARSYMGYQYEGGYSDHLPILLDLDICF